MHTDTVAIRKCTRRKEGSKVKETTTEMATSSFLRNRYWVLRHGKSIPNEKGLIVSSLRLQNHKIYMLRHLQFPSFADQLENAVKRIISEGKYGTKDVGGDSTTQEVVDAAIAKLD